MNHEKKRKARVSISMDPDMWKDLQNLANEIDGESVSGIIEECVKWWVLNYKLAKAPHLVSKLDELEFKLGKAERDRQLEMENGTYGGELEEEICEYQIDIAKERRDLEIAKYLEMKDKSKQPKIRQKGKS